jgi:multicomponent Na+:H+ antiporter subunit G
MNEWISGVLLLIGTVFMLLGCLGLVRMPDLFTRMQAATKTVTLGIGCMFLGVAFHFGDLSVTTRALAVVVFFFITVPVAAHMIARAAYWVGVPLWEHTLYDELRGQYDPQSHALASPDEEADPAGGRQQEEKV